VTLDDAIARVLHFPAVASKQFLITIGDRSITGMVATQPMVGPWQVPVADAAVTLSGYRTYAGEAFAMGERSPLALIDPKAAARMAVRRVADKYC
jgi:phosphoribosylformylglycinamidine synthase